MANSKLGGGSIRMFWNDPKSCTPNGKVYLETISINDQILIYNCESFTGLREVTRTTM